MVEWLDLGTARAVLEYGPGTGPFTPHVVKRLRADCRFLAIERNASLAGEFKSRLPNVQLVQDSVENVRTICDRAGIDSVDCIVCGLPWAAFPDDLQKRLLDAMATVLRPRRPVRHVRLFWAWASTARRAADSRNGCPNISAKSAGAGLFG